MSESARALHRSFARVAPLRPSSARRRHNVCLYKVYLPRRSAYSSIACACTCVACARSGKDFILLPPPSFPARVSVGGRLVGGWGAQEEEEGGTKSSPREGETCTGSLRVQWWWGRGGMRRHHHHRRARASGGAARGLPSIPAACPSRVVVAVSRGECVFRAARLYQASSAPVSIEEKFSFFFFLFFGIRGLFCVSPRASTNI